MPQQETAEVQNTSLEQLRLGFWDSNLLLRNGISSLEQLKAMTDEQLFEIPGVGPGLVNRIRWSLEQYQESLEVRT